MTIEYISVKENLKQEAIKRHFAELANSILGMENELSKHRTVFCHSDVLRQKYSIPSKNWFELYGLTIQQLETYESSLKKECYNIRGAILINEMLV